MKERLSWRRAVLKLSGELLGGEKGPLDERGLIFFAQEIREARKAGVELAVVPGGGNIARGAALPHIPQTTGHTIGMLATLINGLALREALARVGVPSLLMSAIPCAGVAEPVDPWRAREALGEGKVVLLSAGTGNPFVTTDTAAVIRALALQAEVVLKGSKVAGVYPDDPKAVPDVQPLPRISHKEYLARGLRVMDLAAVSIAGDHGLPIFVFRADQPGGLLSALQGKGGSLIG